MSALTRMFSNPCIGAMRMMARRLIPQLSWRHHGIGVLQGYVVEDASPEVRIHIWSPKLIKPGMTKSGDVHDHRFSMTSHVLAGSIGHEEWLPTANENGGFMMTELTHARAAADTKFHGPIRSLPGRFDVTRNNMFVHSGFSYTFPSLRFHRSPVVGLAITCVEKHMQMVTPARLLHPVDCEPVMAFGHDMDETLCAELVNQAREML